MGKHSARKIQVFLSTPMPSGNTHWQFLRETIEAFFAYSDLNPLFELEKIESEGGAAPPQIYRPMIEKSDVLLAVFGNKIPPGQFDEIVEAKRLNKIVFGFFLNYTPMSGDGVKDHKILYDVATINPISCHYDLFGAIITQLIGFFSHSIGDIKRITPKYIEEELKLAFDEDSEELLSRVGDLIAKVGIDDVDVYLMAHIYMMKGEFEDIHPIDDKIKALADENLSAWSILLAIALTNKDREMLEHCLSIEEFSGSKDIIRILFDALVDEEIRKKMIEQQDFVTKVELLADRLVFSCPIFEGIVDEVLDEL